MHTPKHLAINDPAPMVLGERTTRLPPEPVNPRAAFEAFERGAHAGPTVTVRVDASGAKVIRETTTLNPYDDGSKQAGYAELLEVARRHKDEFGLSATKLIMKNTFGANRLVEIGQHRHLEAIAMFKIELEAARAIRRTLAPCAGTSWIASVSKTI